MTLSRASGTADEVEDLCDELDLFSVALVRRGGWVMGSKPWQYLENPKTKNKPRKLFRW
jgi:hypothetical protein